MTEEDARTRWCPMVRIVDSSVPSNTFYPQRGHDKATCIASECAWWVPEPSGYDGHNAPEIKRGGHCGAIR